MQNSAAEPRGLFAGRKGRTRKEALTAYLFLLPAIAVIFVFGLWPVVHALYVSLHKWNIKPKGSQCIPYWLASVGLGPREAVEQTDCLGVDNYVKLLGLQNVSAVVGLIVALILGVAAYSLWKRSNRAEARSTGYRIAAGVVGVVAVFFLVRALPGLLDSGEWTYLVTAGLFVLAWLVWKGGS